MDNNNINRRSAGCEITSKQTKSDDIMIMRMLFLLFLLSPVCALVTTTTASNKSSIYTLRREKRWKTAVATLEASTDTRRRFDHRAHLARLIGIYVGEEEEVLGSKAEILVAMQPDQGGRKLLFLDAVDGRSLGFIELETQSVISQSKIRQTDFVDSKCDDDAIPVTSALRGMLVADDCRGQGYARLFLAVWLRLCLRSGVTPATTRINKPLLALTLVRLGFTPLRGHHLATISNKNHLRGGLREGGNNGDSKRSKPKRKKLKEKQRPLAVEVSVGTEGRVLLYSPLSTDRLRNGFSATEVRSQRLVVATEPSVPRGRVAHLRVRYAPPNRTDTLCGRSDEQLLQNTSQMVHAPLAEGIGRRLRLSASQGPVGGDAHPSTEEREEALRLLTGQL
jgi:GNAT superfamily N-acetyltransferase